MPVTQELFVSPIDAVKGRNKQAAKDRQSICLFSSLFEPWQRNDVFCWTDLLVILKDT